MVTAETAEGKTASNAGGADLNLGVMFPGEALAIKGLDVWIEARRDMDAEIKKEWDREGLRLYRATFGRIVRLLEAPASNGGNG